MENVILSKQEVTKDRPMKNDEEASGLLETVEDFVNQNFKSKGVIANVINQHEKGSFLNVRCYKLTLVRSGMILVVLLLIHVHAQFYLIFCFRLWFSNRIHIC